MIYLYSSILLTFLMLTIVNVLSMPRIKSEPRHDYNDLVSILVPLRNEARNVKPLIDSLKALTYKNLEIILLDDQSIDETGVLLKKYTENDSRFKIKYGTGLPEGWVGKVHACHSLSKHASGEYFFFVDADVRLKEDTVESTLTLAKEKRAALVTGFSRFPVKTFLAKLLVPMQHFLIFTFLPNVIANKTTHPAFTAAHGAFMFFDKKAYRIFGGHEAVKDSLLEDVHIAKELKRKGLKVILANITSKSTCYMYETNREVWKGFLKNIFIGLNRSIVSVVLLSLFFLIFYFFPIVIATVGLISGKGMFVLPLIIIWLHVAIIDIATKQEKGHFFYTPLAACAIVILMFSSMYRSVKNKGYEWKGRMYG